MSQEIDLQDLLEELGGGVANGKDVIQTRYATLFIKEDEEVINIPTGEYAGYNGIPATLPVQTNGKTKSYSLYISEFHHDNSSQHTILNALRKADENSTLEIRLDSPGGYCHEGIKLQAIMKEKFDGRTTTYNDVESCSMGAFIFSSGDKRVMNEYATVMYHNYSGGIFGDGAAMKARFDHIDEVYTRMDKELLVGNGFLTKKEFKEINKRILEILNSKERIAYPSIKGDYVYNFWQDDLNERGLWRRMPLTAYIKDTLQWENILDLDALSKDEGEIWAYKGATFLHPEFDVCMLNLSRGGRDAVEIREFDLCKKEFVDNIFLLKMFSSASSLEL